MAYSRKSLSDRCGSGRIFEFMVASNPQNGEELRVRFDRRDAVGNWPVPEHHAATIKSVNVWATTSLWASPGRKVICLIAVSRIGCSFTSKSTICRNESGRSDSCIALFNRGPAACLFPLVETMLFKPVMLCSVAPDRITSRDKIWR